MTDLLKFYLSICKVGVKDLAEVLYKEDFTAWDFEHMSEEANKVLMVFHYLCEEKVESSPDLRGDRFLEFMKIFVVQFETSVDLLLLEVREGFNIRSKRDDLAMLILGHFVELTQSAVEHSRRTSNGNV